MAGKHFKTTGAQASSAAQVAQQAANLQQAASQQVSAHAAQRFSAASVAAQQGTWQASVQQTAAQQATSRQPSSAATTQQPYAATQPAAAQASASSQVGASSASAARQPYAAQPNATQARVQPQTVAQPYLQPTTSRARQSSTAAQDFYQPMTTGAYAGDGHIGQDQRRSSKRARRKAAASNPYNAGGPYDTGGRADKSKRRRGRVRSVLSALLIIVGVALLGVAGWMWWSAQSKYQVSDENNAELASYATITDSDAEGCPITVDWEGLKAVNDDVVGWIYIPGTVVNYPVYQGEDNEQYLRTTATGEYSIGGQIFMDYENAAPGLVDRQTILYGHHLYNGTMFTQIDDMCDQTKFDEVETVWYLTETNNYEMAPVFIYKTPATNLEARQSKFATDEDFHSYLANNLASASAKSSDAEEAAATVSKVLTLATCDYENDFGQGNGRGLLICALKSELPRFTFVTGSESSGEEAA